MTKPIHTFCDNANALDETVQSCISKYLDLGDTINVCLRIISTFCAANRPLNFLLRFWLFLLRHCSSFIDLFCAISSPYKHEGERHVILYT